MMVLHLSNVRFRDILEGMIRDFKITKTINLQFNERFYIKQIRRYKIHFRY